MAEGGYVAPVQIGKSYSEMFKEQMAEIAKQQQTNLTSQIARRDANNIVKYKQLEQIYGFNMQGWSPQAIGSFKKLQQEAGRKMREAEYENIEDIMADISKLGSLHTSLNNHFTEARTQLLETSKYVDNPALYPDKTSTVIDTQETLAQKKRYSDSLGTDMWEADLQNMDINIPMIGLDGTPIQEVGYGSVLSHPHMSDPSILAPSTRPLGGIPPQEYAREYDAVIDRYSADGLSDATIVQLVRQAMIDEFSSPDAAKRERIEAERMYNEEFNGKPKYKNDGTKLTPEEFYIDEALKYISIGDDTKTSTTSTMTAGDKKNNLRYTNFIQGMTETQATGSQILSDKEMADLYQKTGNPLRVDGKMDKEFVTFRTYTTTDSKLDVNLNDYADQLYPDTSDPEMEEVMAIAGVTPDGKPSINIKFDSVSFDSKNNVILSGITNENDKSTKMPDKIMIPAEDYATIDKIVNTLQQDYGIAPKSITLDKLMNGFPQGNNAAFGGVKFNG